MAAAAGTDRRPESRAVPDPCRGMRIIMMTSKFARPEQARFNIAIARLSPMEREVLKLSAAENLDLDEVAARLGITSEAAAGHLADALYRLHRLLDRSRRPARRSWWGRLRAWARRGG